MRRVVLALEPPKTVFYTRERQPPKRFHESPAPRRDPYQHFDRGPSILLDRSPLQSHQRTRFGLRLRNKSHSRTAWAAFSSEFSFKRARRESLRAIYHHEA